MTFIADQSNPYRPHLEATDGTKAFDATGYGISEATSYRYHATQVNVQGTATLAHNYTVYSHPSTLSFGVKIRNSYSTQRQNSQDPRPRFQRIQPFYPGGRNR